MFTEAFLCQTFAILSGSVHFVKRCATAFYSFRSREFQKRSFFRNDLGREFEIPRERRRVTSYYEFRLISAIVGLFPRAKACQFHAVQHVLNQVRLVRDPLLQMRSAEELLEFRTQPKGVFDFDLRCRPVTELRLRHRRDKVHHPVARHIDRLKNGKRLGVAPLTVFVEEDAVVIPAGMVRAELDRPRRQLNAALPVARVTEKSAHIRHGVTTARIQGQRTLGRRAKSTQIAAEVLHHGESVIRHLTGKIGIEGALCCKHGALQ
jgi:hypothetical protein